MTTEKFWYGEPREINSYFIAKRLKDNEVNYQSWLFGIYVMRAVAVNLNDGKHKIEYYKEPIKELSYDVINNWNSSKKNKKSLDEISNNTFNSWARRIKKK